MKYQNKALVTGRIGLVKMLGRENIPVTLVRESDMVFERFSRYCTEFVQIPNLVDDELAAVEIIENYGRGQSAKPAVFMNGESDVILFSQYRDRLSRYYHIMLADHELLTKLVNKNKFALLAEQHYLSTPKTFMAKQADDFLKFADQLGYPCILKPIQQRLWHTDEVYKLVGMVKAILINSRPELEQLLEKFPYHDGNTMIQQYIPGDDQQLYDCHLYINPAGTLKGSIVGRKIRTFPVQFGSGCYTRYVEAPEISHLCHETLTKIGYIGAANINVKKDSTTGQLYLLEINPRYSLWSGFDANCGVNLALMQYCDMTGQDLPKRAVKITPTRWLFVGHDIKAMREYRKRGELTWWGWLSSFFKYNGKLKFHLFSLDDPLPYIGYRYFETINFFHRLLSYFKKRLF